MNIKEYLRTISFIAILFTYSLCILVFFIEKPQILIDNIIKTSIIFSFIGIFSSYFSS